MRRLIPIATIILIVFNNCFCSEKREQEYKEMKPEIVERDGFTIVGMRFNGKIGEDNSGIGDLWGKFSQTWEDIPNRTNMKECYGFDTWSEEMMKEGKFTYYCAVEVKNDSEVPENMEVVKVPATKYAVFSYPQSQNGDGIVQEIFKVHFPKSGFKMNGNFDFEFYDENFNPDNPDSKVKFHIPIK